MGTVVVLPWPISATMPLYNLQIYMVAPTLKSDKTELFITRTDWAFNFSKTLSMILALYFLSLKEESMMRISAAAGSTPMSSLRAYSHISVMSSKELS